VNEQPEVQIESLLPALEKETGRLSEVAE